jgi:hypothetical protein
MIFNVLKFYNLAFLILTVKYYSINYDSLEVKFSVYYKGL